MSLQRDRQWKTFGRGGQSWICSVPWLHWWLQNLYICQKIHRNIYQKNNVNLQIEIWKIKLYKKVLPYNLAIPIQVSTQEKKTPINTKIHAQVSRAALFVTAKMWKLSKWASAGEWRKTLESSYTMQFNSPTKRNQILIHATVCMNLKNNMLSERSRIQRSTYCIILTRWNV